MALVRFVIDRILQALRKAQVDRKKSLLLQHLVRYQVHVDDELVGLECAKVFLQFDGIGKSHKPR